LLLAAAGLLQASPATTYWLARERLAPLGARVVEDRVVQHGKILTAAGISSIDMALRLVALMHGDEVAQAVRAVFHAREAEVLDGPAGGRG
jgi:transcriptional regulator GlxA family with amidase domain